VQGGASARNFLGGGLAAEGPVRMMQQDQIRN
jgi:hypothetical protein